MSWSNCRKKKKVLIVKVVDLLNPESSFIHDFADLIGNKHPVILVGNKVDLLPKSAVYSRVTNWLRHLFRKHVASVEQVNLKCVMLVSSLSGINMKRLASRIEKYRDGADVYVVGTTNVGKSTFINRLVHLVNGTYPSLYEPPKLYRKANIKLDDKNSPVPEDDSIVFQDEEVEEGEFLNEEEELEALNAVNNEASTIQAKKTKLVNDNKQMKNKQEVDEDEDEEEEENGKNNKKNASQQHQSVEMDSQLNNYEPQSKPPPMLTESMMPGTTIRPISFTLKSAGRRGGHYEHTAHLYDTPGVINPFLPANILSPSEYKYIHPSRKIKPRFVRMVPGKSLFLGGFARIDYVSNEGNPYEDWNLATFTVFGSNQLPLHVSKIENADRIYENHLGNFIYPPKNKTDHPDLVGLIKKKEVMLHGVSRLKAISDISVGGVCWVAVTGVGNLTLQIHAPKPVQIFVRELPLMPFETYKLKKTKIEIDAKK